MSLLSWWFLQLIIIIYRERNVMALGSIENMVIAYEDDKNSMIALTDKDSDLFEDFYEELDNQIIFGQTMDIIFFGPPHSFLRLDTESILHILIKTRKNSIPVVRTMLAWDVITDGKTAAFITGRELVSFGALLNVVPEEDLYYVNFGVPSVLRYFADSYPNIHERKFGVLVSAYRRYFGDMWHANASAINELGYLICGFPSSDLAKITPATYMDISAETFLKLDRCTVNQTKTLYNIAVHPDAFGEPYKWSSHEVGRLGSLFKLVPAEDISSIQLEAVTAISPRVLKKISQKKLEFFTKPQIMRLTPKARRIYILRIQLMHSLDMSQIVSNQ